MTSKEIEQIKNWTLKLYDEGKEVILTAKDLLKIHFEIEIVDWYGSTVSHWYIGKECLISTGNGMMFPECIRNLVYNDVKVEEVYAEKSMSAKVYLSNKAEISNILSKNENIR